MGYESRFYEPEPPITRERIVAAARVYIDTPFGHQGRTKGRALDCVGLPLMVAGDLGLVDKDGQPLHGGCYTTYSPQPVGNYVYQMCQKHLVYKPVREMLPGDVLVFAVPSAPCHVGIVSAEKGAINIIHAYNVAGKCVEHVLDVKWQRRIVGCFKFPEVED